MKIKIKKFLIINISTSVGLHNLFLQIFYKIFLIYLIFLFLFDMFILINILNKKNILIAYAMHEHNLINQEKKYALENFHNNIIKTNSGFDIKENKKQLKSFYKYFPNTYTIFYEPKLNYKDLSYCLNSKANLINDVIKLKIPFWASSNLPNHKYDFFLSYEDQLNCHYLNKSNQINKYQIKMSLYRFKTNNQILNLIKEYNINKNNNNILIIDYSFILFKEKNRLLEYKEFFNKYLQDDELFELIKNKKLIFYKNYLLKNITVFNNIENYNYLNNSNFYLCNCLNNFKNINYYLFKCKNFLK